MMKARGRMLFGSRISQACCGLVAVLGHAAPAAAGGLDFYTNQAEFEQANVDLRNAQKGVEDFEESVLPPNVFVPIDDPLEPGVANGPFPNGLEGLDNIQIQSNVLGPNPFVPAPLGPNGMVALAVGALGVTSDVVVYNFVGHSYDIIVLDEVTMSVGFNPVAFSGGQVNVRVYDTANNFLGENPFNADPFATEFAGVISTVPIGRINIFDAVRGGGDNIQKWVNCPQIQNVTQGTFHCTIQDAIDEATSGFQGAGDEIVVQEGTYFENINFLGKAITLRSTDPTDPVVVAATIIDAAGSGRVVTCESDEGPDTVLSGFTITGGNVAMGAGMQNTAGSSPTVTNCRFIDNHATNNGGGMRNLNGSSPTVTNCTFIGNTAFQGGGMSNNTGSSPTVTNCTFSGNSADLLGAGMLNLQSSPTVTNCTFSGNTADDGSGGAMYNFESSPTVTNCILWGDSPGEIFNCSSTPTVTYSNVQGGFAGTGNIDADPMFVDPDNDNLRLGNCSPSTDAGDNDAVPGGITTDLDGNPRFVDDAGVADTGFGDPPIVDMGAYERQVDSPSGGVMNVTQGTFHCTIQEAIDEATSGFQGAGDEIVVQEGTYFENINFLGKAITLRSTDPTDPAVVAATIIDAAGSGRVVHCNSGEGPDTVLSGFTITGGNAPNGAGMQNGAGSSPTVTNCTFIDNVADDNGGGMRNLNGSSPTVTNCTFSGNSAVAFNGGGMANSSQSHPTVTNCTFTGNTATIFGGGMYNHSSSPTVTNCTFSGNMIGQSGGGMYNVQSSPTVTNCTFSGNEAGAGGGMLNFNNASPTVTNCTFSGNTAPTAGGGMYNSNSNPVVTNCTFTGNSTGGFGGGMLNVGFITNMTVTNCTFSGNTAFVGAGMYSDNNADQTVTNCILWGDSPDEFSGGMPTVTYSNVQGGFTGTGNIDADPLFVDPGSDDYRISAGSPCIDAADNTAPDLAGIIEDLDGNPRFIEDPKTSDTGLGDCPVVDMGSYEFQDGTPDCCPWDLDGSGTVGATDLLSLLVTWGPCDDCNDCPADFDGNCTVGATDLLALLVNWGPCP